MEIFIPNISPSYLLDLATYSLSKFDASTEVFLRCHVTG